MDVQNFLRKLVGRKISIVGFESFKLESAVIALLRSLPNSIFIGNRSFDDVRGYIDSQAFNRDLRLRNILSNAPITLVVDMNTIYSNRPNQPNAPITTSQDFQELILHLKQKVFHNDYNIYTGAPLREINIIFLNKTYKSAINNTNTFRGGNRMLYICDFCVIFTETHVHIVKDRDGHKGKEKFNPIFFQRDMVLKGLLK